MKVEFILRFDKMSKFSEPVLAELKALDGKEEDFGVADDSDAFGVLPFLFTILTRKALDFFFLKELLHKSFDGDGFVLRGVLAFPDPLDVGDVEHQVSELLEGVSFVEAALALEDGDLISGEVVVDDGVFSSFLVIAPFDVAAFEVLFGDLAFDFVEAGWLHDLVEV